MSKDNEIFEIENRYCPICGKFVYANSPLHRCLDKDLKKIDNLEEDLDFVEDRSYDDKLDEFNKFYDSDSYYDDDLEEG